MAAVCFVHVPTRALSNPHLPETETAACRIHVKEEEGEGEEQESMVEFPPETPGSSLDNALWIPSDDDDDDDSDDDGFPSLSEIFASNAPRALGAPATPGSFGGPEASADDALPQVNIDDGANSDGADESLPKTQGTSADTAIVIPQDVDEDEDGGEEEEDNCQLDAVCPPPLESNASGILEGGPDVRSAGIPDRGTPEDPTTAVERDFVSGYASQEHAQDMQPASPPNARVESRDPASVSPLASSDTSALKRRHEDDDGDDGDDHDADETDDADTTDGQDTAETSDTECYTPVQLPSPPRYKSPLSPCGHRAGVVRRPGDRAQEDKGETMPSQHRLLHQDSGSGDNKPTQGFGEVGGEDDEDDEDYNPHAEAAQPQRKRRKISMLSRGVRERLTSDDLSEGGTAADTVQATYDEWPLQDVLLKRVTEGGRTVFQLQFAWYSGRQQRPRAYGSRTASAREARVSGTKFTKDEDALLIKLKEDDGLHWAEIHRRFSKRFRGRSRGALQVRYSTKLKGRR